MSWRSPLAQLRRQLNISLAMKAGGRFRNVSPGFNGASGKHGCRFIEGEPVSLVRAHADPFCGKPTQGGSSYCPEHHKRCFVVVYVPGKIRKAA